MTGIFLFRISDFFLATFLLIAQCRFGLGEKNVKFQPVGHLNIVVFVLLVGFYLGEPISGGFQVFTRLVFVSALVMQQRQRKLVEFRMPVGAHGFLQPLHGIVQIAGAQTSKSGDVRMPAIMFLSRMFGPLDDLQPGNVLVARDGGGPGQGVRDENVLC